MNTEAMAHRQGHKGKSINVSNGNVTNPPINNIIGMYFFMNLFLIYKLYTGMTMIQPQARRVASI
jgi:hypothetical protein